MWLYKFVCVLTISESRIKRCPTLRDLKNATQVIWRIFQADTGPLIKTRSCFILSKSGGYNLQVGIHFMLHNFFLLNLSGSLKSKLFAMGIFNGNFEKNSQYLILKFSWISVAITTLANLFPVEDICSYFYRQQLDLSVWISLIRKSVLFAAFEQAFNIMTNVRAQQAQ